MRTTISTRAWPVLAAWLAATACAGQNPQAQQTREEDRLRSGLSVKCSVTEEQTPAAPYVRGALRFDITLELANAARDGVQFNDVLILLDGSAGQDYTGAYAVFHRAGSSGGVWGSDYYDRAHNYAIPNHVQYWPEGGMAGFLDGGTHQQADYKAPGAVCNTLLAPGAKVRYTISMSQGVWLKRELSSRLLVVLPEIVNVKTAAAPHPAYRVVLTLKRAAESGDRWDLSQENVIQLETGRLKRLLTASQADLPMRVLALNWLAAVDKKSAAPVIFQNIKQRNIGKDFVASVQLLGYHGIPLDDEALQAIKEVASAKEGSSWDQMAAARYLRPNAMKTTSGQKE